MPPDGYLIMFCVPFLLVVVIFILALIKTIATMAAENLPSTGAPQPPKRGRWVRPESNGEK